MGSEKKSNYYDDFFIDNPNFHCHYKDSYYYVHWTQVIAFLKKIKNPKILEIGSGTGQLAEYIYDEGFIHYSGFDFSKTAINLALKRNLQLKIWVGDARDSKQYENIDYNTVICLEVLEHVNDDLKIITNIKSSSNLICSVPNFDAPSHVRWFTTEYQIKKRYYRLIDIAEIIRIGNIFLFRGVRSDFNGNVLQALLATRENITLTSVIKRIKHRLKNVFKIGSL